MKANILSFLSIVSLILCCVQEGTSKLTVSTSVQGQGVAGYDVVIACKYHPPSTEPEVPGRLGWFVNNIELGRCEQNDSSKEIGCGPKMRDSSKYSFTADGVCCGNMTIKRLTMDDETTYRCTAVTREGIGYSDTNLTIIHPRLPDTQDLTGTDNLQANVSQEITCTSVHSYPAPTFRWYIDYRDVTADAVSLPPETEGEGGRGEVANATSVLTYRPSRTDHGRNLICSLSLSVSPFNLTVLNSSVILDIHYPPIIFQPKASAKWSGESCTASLSCAAEANPPVNHFHWLKLGTEFVYNSSRMRHSINASGGFHDNERIGTLLIEDVQSNDYGSYQCIVYDEDGERNLTSGTLSLSRPSHLYRPTITVYPDRASSSSICVAWQPRHNGSIDGTSRLVYCQLNTSEEDCNTTTSASGANATLTGLQSFTWYRLTLYFTNCSGNFSIHPLPTSTAPLPPNEYGIISVYDWQKRTLKVLKSSEKITLPDEICFKLFKSLDPTDCSRTNEEQCVPAGSTLRKVVPLKSGFVGVVSYGRETCSAPSFIRVAKPSSAAPHDFILTVTGATVVVAVVILALVFGVMMLTRLCSHCSKKKAVNQEETSAAHRRADNMDERGGTRTVDEDGLIYVAVSHEGARSSTQQTSPMRTEEQTVYSLVTIEGSGTRCVSSN